MRVCRKYGRSSKQKNKRIYVDFFSVFCWNGRSGYKLPGGAHMTLE